MKNLTMKEIPIQCDYYACGERGTHARCRIAIGEDRYNICEHYETHRNFMKTLNSFRGSLNESR